MNDHSKDSQTRYLREAAIALAKEGFQSDEIHADRLCIQLDGSPLCEVTESGGITYRNEDIDEPERIDAKDKVYEIVKTTAEYMRQMETAPSLKADGLEDGYKVLADFNGTVLAGVQSKHGAHFVTWDWAYGHTGVPQGIKKIAPRAFQHCNLWELTIPDSVEEIGNCAFLCTHLTVVELPNGLKKLGPGCFCGTDLKKIRIPGSVEVAQGFSNCDALREIIIENGVNRIDDLDWNSALKKIELPESIREISKGAFTKCEKLKTIVIKAPQCTLDPEMLFYDHEKDEAKKSKIQILCTEEVAKAAPENLKRFCVSNTKEKSGSHVVGGAGAGHLYGSLTQFDVSRMIQDVAPGYTFDDPIFPKSETRKVPYGDTTISVKLRLQKLSKVQRELSGRSYAFYTALENMLTKDDVVALIEEEDPNYTSDAAYFARPMVDSEAPSAAWSDVKNGFLFLSYIAFRLTDADVLREVVAAMPRKKNGTFYKGRLLRIACPGFVTSESIPQIYAKADGDDAITISADCKSISEGELEKFEKDFVSTHQELFQLSKYSLT